MKDDNTPTVNAKTRKLSSKKRLRTENAKLRKSPHGLLSAQSEGESKRVTKEDSNPALEVTPEVSKDQLTNSTPTVPKFRKRQLNKQWLPTHLYHAKRAHMTPPQEPLWRFAIPLTPTEKSYRMTHRAGVTRGCVTWDMSYMSTIGMEGPEKSVERALRSLDVPDELFEKKGHKWKTGSRSWTGWLRESLETDELIAPVTIIWCARTKSSSTDPPLSDRLEPSFRSKQSLASDQVHDGPKSGDSKDSRRNKGTSTKSACSLTSRKIFIRVHPSAFLELWRAVLKAAKAQTPPAMVEDLRFEIGSIELTGPASTEALIAILKPAKATSTGEVETTRVWQAITTMSNSASLPSDVLLAMDVTDPRLRYPPRRSSHIDAPSEIELLQLLARWPLDDHMSSSALFDSGVRRAVVKRLLSQKSINRRKGEAPPGEYPKHLPSDMTIPALLLSTCYREARASQGNWTVLLPWKCVLPIWYSLMYHPISTGGNPRFGGLNEQRQINFERCIPWFPGDYPGTEAGWKWEIHERSQRKAEWEKRPKAKRVEWTSLKLGQGSRGEIGLGWACDWQRLFELNHVARKAQIPDEATETRHAPEMIDELRPVHVPKDRISAMLDVALGIVSVKIDLIHVGVPKSCARIYRLPTADASAHAKWSALAATKSLARARINALYLKASNETHCQDKDPAMSDPRHPPLPGESDLIGFVTTGNFNLGEGRATGIGCIAVSTVKDQLAKGQRAGLCIVRESGNTVGRISRWTIV